MPLGSRQESGDQPSAWGEGLCRPSDTIVNYTGSGLDEDSAVCVIGDGDSHLGVDGGLVGGVGLGEGAQDRRKQSGCRQRKEDMRRPIILGILVLSLGLVTVSTLAAGPSGPPECPEKIVASFTLPAAGPELEAARGEGRTFDTALAAASFFWQSYSDAGRVDGKPVGDLRETADATAFEIVTPDGTEATVVVDKVEDVYLIEGFSFCVDAVPTEPLRGVEVDR